MSLIDDKLIFSEKQAVTGTSATSTNVLDFGLEKNNISGNVHGAGYLNVQCCVDAEPYSEKASGTLTFASNPSASATLQIGSKVVTYVASSPTDEQILLGDTAAKTIANTIAYDFGSSVVLAQDGDNKISVTATAAGTAGNSVILASGTEAITVSGAHLSGGTAANTVTVKLQDSDDNSDFSDVAGTSVSVSDPKAGTQVCMKVPEVKRYVRVAYGASRSLTAGKWDAYLGQPISKH